MQDLLAYEKKKNELRQFLKKLDAECKARFGPHNKYAYPSSNPYKKYADADDFKKRVIGKDGDVKQHVRTGKVCKFISEASTEIDKKKRYYSDVQNARECSFVEGAWDAKSLNRKNKFDEGVCWTSERDKACGSAVTSPDVLRAYRGRYSKDAPKAIVEQAARCQAVPGCKWEQQTAYTYDCVRDDSAPKSAEKGPAESPPEAMPTVDAEAFLEEWYLKNKHGKPPKTTGLMGRGDRCNGPGEALDAINNPDPDSLLPPEPATPPETANFRLMNPTSTKDAVVFRKYMSDSLFKVFKTEWVRKNKMGDSGYRKWLSDDMEDIVEAFYRRMDKARFEVDYRVGSKREAVPAAPAAPAAPKLYPSVPQSVVNMVLKNAVAKKSKKRGLLAWHSTGSGKCHARDALILMRDGSVKLVQDVRVGDELMGDDSSPRVVTSLATGEDEMYEIVAADGERYRVNSEHVLCLKAEHGEDVYEIEVRDYLKLSESARATLRGYRAGVEFPSRPVKIDPYLLGSRCAQGIPDNYKINDRPIRLAVLAGIVDSLGEVCYGGYDVCAPCERFCEDVAYLARSLGFAAIRMPAQDGHRVTIYGEGLEAIPVRVVDASELKRVKGALSYAIEVRSVGRGEYYGFTIDGNHRYLIGDFTVTHNTCTATGVMDAYWDTDYQIIFASSIDAIASNPDFVFHKCAANLFPRFQKAPFDAEGESERLARVAQAFKARKIRFLSFAKLSNRVANAIEYKKLAEIAEGGAARKKATPAKKAALPAAVPSEKAVAKARAALESGKPPEQVLASDDFVDLDKCVLIVDEVHNLFRPLANQVQEHARLEAELVDPNKHPGLRVVILTATPGDNVPDVLKLLNMVRDAGAKPIEAFDVDRPETVDRFKRSIRGLISYFDMSADDTKFPVVSDGEATRCAMSEAQREKYAEAYKGVKPSQKDYVALAKANKLGDYWQPARKYANMLFSRPDGMALEEFSSKLPHAIERIMSLPNEKHYLYSAFYTRAGYGGHGVVAIAKELEKRGYSKLTIDEAKKLNKSGKVPKPANRYVLAINTELGEEGGSAGQNLHELLKIYNHAANKDGSLVHVMLASNKYNESIDLKSVSNIHLFEPFVTMAGERQAIGRAVRYCSFAQKDRSAGEWVVKIHRYVSDVQTPVKIDFGAVRAAIAEEISALEARISAGFDKEALKAAKKSVKDKEKEIAKAEKALETGKGSKASVDALKAELAPLLRAVSEAEALETEAKAGVADLKAMLREKNKELKKIDQPAKKAAPAAVEDVEKQIFEESRERFKELSAIYQCMRDAAIDCRLLREFHEKTSGQKIACF